MPSFSSPPEPEETRPVPAQDDPLYRHSRREAVIILLVWAVFAIWVTGYSRWKGYLPTGEFEGAETVWGMPSWVFWGVGLPWVMANLVTFWFCFRQMADDPLGPVNEQAESAPRLPGRNQREEKNG